jgi:small basic protein
MFLLFAVAIIAAVCGSLGSAVAKRKQRRTRGFVAGLFCGMTLATVLRYRRRGLSALDALARSAGIRLPGADASTRRRQLRRVGR